MDDEDRLHDYLEDGFDPWEKIGRCGGYNSDIDQQEDTHDPD